MYFSSIINNHSASQNYLFRNEDEVNVEFEDIGLSSQLCSALRMRGKIIPTIIQKAAFDVVRGGKDVAIAAETGTPILLTVFTCD